MGGDYVLRAHALSKASVLLRNLTVRLQRTTRTVVVLPLRIHLHVPGLVLGPGLRWAVLAAEVGPRHIALGAQRAARVVLVAALGRRLAAASAVQTAPRPYGCTEFRRQPKGGGAGSCSVLGRLCEVVWGMV